MTPHEVSQIDFTNVWIGEFHFLRKLGEGGFAAVWLAEQCDLNRTVQRRVAIKVFLDDRRDSESFNHTVENFRKDANYLAELSSGHPIVTYYSSDVRDLAIDENRVLHTLSSRVDTKADDSIVRTAFLLVMEWADGGSLDETYRRQVILQRTDKKWIDHFLDICTALKAAHGHIRKIMHRDIKPHNLLWFREQDRVKIGDFGTAKDLSEVDLSAPYILGSLPYMSPESFQGISSPARDVYALGCTFYELLTGNHAITLTPGRVSGPHFRNTVDYYREAHETRPRPDAFLAARQLISINFSHVLKEMMDPDPAKRPSLDTVMAALEKERPELEADATHEAAEPPTQPIYLGVYDIHPHFRIAKAREQVYFLSIRTTIPGGYRLKLLLGLLRTWFEESFSLYELFGRRDFLIRIWAANESRVRDFCSTVIERVLHDQEEALLVMVCDKAYYLGTKGNPHYPDGSDETLLITLHEAQKHNHEAARKTLVRRGIYCRRSVRSADGSRIRCFTLVTNEAGTAEAERAARFAMVKQTIEDSGLNLRAWNFSLYSKAYQPLNGLKTDSSDYLLSYSAPAFSDIVSIPSLILDALKSPHLQTDTLLATKRYFIESDQFYFSEARDDKR